MNIFAVYDSKAGAFLQPFFERNSLTATRAFAQVANTPDHAFNRHPADFTLFHIGTWDEFTGTIEPSNAKSALGTALEHIDATPKVAPRLVVQGGE